MTNLPLPIGRRAPSRSQGGVENVNPEWTQREEDGLDSEEEDLPLIRPQSSLAFKMKDREGQAWRIMTAPLSGGGLPWLL